MMDKRISTCDHFDKWQSHQPTTIGVEGGALVVTVMYCTSCGHVEYRSPPINQEDEAALEERMNQISRKKKLLEPAGTRRA